MYPKSLEIIEEIEKKAPGKLAIKGDNVGLQVGSLHNEVKKCLLTLDVTEEVLEEGIKNEVDLIISHHPFIYESINKINVDELKGKIISRAIENKITIYSAHTNLDVALEIGVNCVLASRLGIYDTEVLHTTYKDDLFKLTVFVPSGYEDKVRQEITKKGAGWVGKYSNCTFSTKGEGTFKPLEGTKPFLGEMKELNRVEEVRLETIVPAEKLNEVLEGMENAHPYEEVAFDLYPLISNGKEYGLGLVGELDSQMEVDDFIKYVKKELELANIRVIGKKPEKIKRVAFCGGSGERLISEAFLAGAEVYITGDIKYHAAIEAYEENKFILDAGHYGTEFPLLFELKKYLENIFGKDYSTVFYMTKKSVDPYEIM